MKVKVEDIKNELRKNKEVNMSFVRIDNKNKDKRKVNILKYLNIVFLMLAFLALIYEMAVFSFCNWFTDVFLCAQIIFLTSNLCFLALHPDLQLPWLRYKIVTIYIPFGLEVISSIVEMALFNSVLYD